ncbi:uncharacterized protein LY79DRAFT_51285 [Colletotrichum navitas]|uniref:MutL C-terminal dimerisation domain-containing protein n=1 Tax=Colletotrichum navitas TaxID=681940 RepID=A0AAD8Q693_9PEZI|nr:uncharacterized protein LY79DRAFT_51285 [Colletotrichum navitas]KAK1596693.1 hypothetical protein LY79DRAFT_51285 [Colletotrichum navitas]
MSPSRPASANAHLDTSRHAPEFECHGVNGSFLASVAALSLLTITSHHHLHNSQNSLTIHNSRVLARNIPALPEQRLVAFNHGTRVTVRDLFGSMAVRVKQRAAASEKAAIDREWGRLVHDVVVILLAWPSDVALFVRDTVNSNETHFRPTATPRSEILTRSSRILAQSGLVDGLGQAPWTPIGASVGKLSIQGCISLNPAATRRAQFISFGIHPVTNEHGTKVLYNEVNRVFIKSGFTEEEEVKEDVAISSDSPLATWGASSGKITRSKRGLERWPMFYFRISSTSRTRPLLSSSIEDLLDARNCTLADIIDLLKLVCYEFLKKHHFRPHKVTTSLRGSSKHKQKDELGAAYSREEDNRPLAASLPSSRSNSVTPISRSQSPFDLWQRVKVGRVLEGKWKSGTSTPTSSEASRAKPVTPLSEEDLGGSGALQPSLRFLDDSGNLLRKPFEDLDANFASKGNEPRERGCVRPLSPATDDQVHSHRETSGHIMDGGQVSPLEEPLGASQTPKAIDPEPLSSSQFFAASRNQSQRQEPSEWLKGLLSQWENPVFQPAEPPVPRLNEGTMGGPHRVAMQSLDLDAECTHGTHTSNIKLSGRISKAALADAEVVSQVDQKFILVKLRRDQVSGSGRPDSQFNSVLVLVDQHAADERCRLESLMRDYFRPAKGSGEVIAKTETLQKPLRFEFSAKECKMLRKYNYHFRRWGVFYEIEESEEAQWRHRSKQLSKVDVTGLPPSILERCRSEPRLLAELLRQEVWRAEEGEVPPVRPLTLANGGLGHDIDWVSNFHGCPQGILALLNSRSCRSAIMFNDVLSKDECKSLVLRLSRCSFPFQCAHGRPSMVPLVDMRTLNMNHESHLDSFGSRLKQSGMTK